MAESQKAHHCRFYNNGNGMTMNVNKELTDKVKTCFHPMQDYSAVYDPIKETLTIFNAKPPS